MLRWLAFLLPGVFGVTLASAQDLGIHGRSYGITEPEMVEVIKDRMRAKVLSGEFDRMREEARDRVKEHFTNPPPVANLQPATESRVFFYDPTIRVEEAIRAPSGAIVVPAGTQINPLEYSPFTQTWLILDGREEKQMHWARERLSQPEVKAIFIAGKWMDKWREWGTPTYVDQGGAIVRRLGIVSTPAIIRQSDDGRSIRVEEVHIR